MESALLFFALPEQLSQLRQKVVNATSQRASQFMKKYA
jgi:hypothetical protein